MYHVFQICGITHPVPKNAIKGIPDCVTFLVGRCVCSGIFGLGKRRNVGSFWEFSRLSIVPHWTLYIPNGGCAGFFVSGGQEMGAFCQTCHHVHFVLGRYCSQRTGLFNLTVPQRHSVSSGCIAIVLYAAQNRDLWTVYGLAQRHVRPMDLILFVFTHACVFGFPVFVHCWVDVAFFPNKNILIPPLNWVHVTDKILGWTLELKSVHNAGIAQWQSRSFPSFRRGFDSLYPLFF